MADHTVLQQLQAQIAEQSEALESLSALLAEEASTELQQVLLATLSSLQQIFC